MDYEKIRFWISIAEWVTTAGVWLYVWNVNRNRVTDKRITALEEHMDEKMDGHADRIARLEQDTKHAPNHEDMKRLHQRLDGVNGELKEMRGQFTTANHTLTLIHRHLLEKKQ